MKKYGVGILGSLMVLGGLLTVVLVWSLLIGWILTLILPFELFEGTLLALLSTGIVIYVFANVPDPEDEEWEDDLAERYTIPVERFAKNEADETWENWVNYELANVINYEFKQSHVARTLTDEQRETKAIRLSAAAVAILKRKSPRSTKIEITTPQLRRQLKQVGSKLVDDDILDVAAQSINEALITTPIQFAVREKAWDKSVPMVVNVD